MFNFIKTWLKIRVSVLIFLVLSLVLLGIAGLAYWKMNISTISIRPTRLNINQITKDNKLIVVQHGVDYFLNTGDFTSIISYTVQAGFDLSTAKVSYQSDHNNNVQPGLVEIQPKIVIKLPKPKVLNVDKSDEESEIIIHCKSNISGFEFNKALRTFGEEFSKYVALKRGILSQANYQAKAIFDRFGRSLGREIEVITSDPDPVDEISVINGIQPVKIETKKLDTWEIVPTTPYEFRGHKSFNLLNALNSNVSAFSYPMINWNDSLNNFLKSITSSSKNYVQFNPLDPKVKFGMIKDGSNKICFYYQYNGVIYAITLEAPDEDVLCSVMPSFLFIAYGFKKNESFKFPVNCSNISGHTLKEFRQWSTVQKREYFRDLAQNLVQMKFYDLHIINLNFQYQIPVLSNSEGEKEFRENEADFTKTIEKAASELQVSLANILGIVYDYNMVRRERFAFFLPEDVIFYTPKRVLKAFLKKEKVLQSAIVEHIPYSEFGERHMITFKDDAFCYIMDNEEKCFDKGGLSDFFRFSKDTGFIKLMLCREFGTDEKVSKSRITNKTQEMTDSIKDETQVTSRKVYPEKHGI